MPAPPGAVALWVPVPRATHPCCGNLPCPALHRQLHVQIREAPTWEGHEFLIYRGTTLHSFFIESPHLTLGVFVHLIKNGSCLIDFIYHCCRRQHSPGMVAVLPPGTRLGPRCPLCSALVLLALPQVSPSPELPWPEEHQAEQGRESLCRTQGQQRRGQHRGQEHH